MKKFYSSIGFILCFLITCITTSSIFGDKFLNKFLVLVLVSQILINADDTIALIEKIALKKPKTETGNTGIDNKGDYNARV